MVFPAVRVRRGTPGLGKSWTEPGPERAMEWEEASKPFFSMTSLNGCWYDSERAMAKMNFQEQLGNEAKSQGPAEETRAEGSEGRDEPAAASGSSTQRRAG
jgi:hypothetical protein